MSLVPGPAPSILTLLRFSLYKPEKLSLIQGEHKPGSVEESSWEPMTMGPLSPKAASTLDHTQADVLLE